MRAAFNSKAWREWLAKVLAGHGVYYPAEAGGRVHWSRLRPDELSPDAPEPAWAFRSIRAAEPVKSFFFSPEERVATLPEKLVPGAQEKRVLLGLKACDVAALRVQEVMFGKGEFADPFYATRRREALLVAADCPVPAENCFCNLVGGKPYAEDGADIVMAQVDGQFVLEARSPEGEQLLAAGGRLWQPATEGMIAKRDEERLAAVKRLEQLNPAQWRPDLPQALNKRTTDRAFWAEHARACVECFGCLMTCPTCYCFLLYDSAREQGMARTRVWDACYLAAYQRVGGGANPRAEFLKRFANRFHCKFEHFRNTNGFYACSGCGRCFKTCMGGIDIRKVLGAV